MKARRILRPPFGSSGYQLCGAVCRGQAFARPRNRTRAGPRAL
jgi:hypothetical protein